MWHGLAHAAGLLHAASQCTHAKPPSKPDAIASALCQQERIHHALLTWQHPEAALERNVVALLQVSGRCVFPPADCVSDACTYDGSWSLVVCTWWPSCRRAGWPIWVQAKACN